MSERFDVIVVGSGFGGSVMALRMAEKGHRVLVLERGRRWRADEYPSVSGKHWLYDEDRPAKVNGWADLRFFNKMVVAQGAGVGGGSLIYANVQARARPELFLSGWPQEITYPELEGFYAKVHAMLEARTVPGNQRTARSKLMERAARALGDEARFQEVDIAVRFDEGYDLRKVGEPDNESNAVMAENVHGQVQGTCVHLGYCDLGCPVLAKNTLDLNYIPAAEKLGAEVRPLHLVRHLEPLDGGGYRVHFDDLRRGRREAGSADAGRVVLAAGSLGSTEILLRCRDQYGTLPGLSDRLGEGWSSNGDFLTPAFYDRYDPRPTVGPTITAAIDHFDGTETLGGERFWVQEGGFPPVLSGALRRKVEGGWKSRTFRKGLEELREKGLEERPLDNVMPWFAQGLDRPEGRLVLRRDWLPPWRKKLDLKWKKRYGKAVVESIIDMHVRLTEDERLPEEIRGRAKVPVTWKKLGYLVTPHPLGGCRMADDPSRGVVDHSCRVFGYEDLWVVDGAVIPTPIGRNPSMTIAAIAERAATLA